jgi:hydrogenase nickel incorporation protein HypA/HybF
MHEAGIVQSLLTLAGEKARAAGAGRIESIRIRVGRMTGVVPEALEQAFTILRAGTIASGAALDVEYVPGAFWCSECGGEFETDELIGACPTCGEPSADLRRGREMDLVSLEVE